MNVFAHAEPAVILLAMTSVTLYALLGQRSWVLWGPPATYGLVEPGAWLGVIRALIAALPLLGLLASVGGISDTFHQLSMAAGGAATRHAGSGIGLALGATQAGILAALPAVIWERLLQRRIAVLEHREALEP